MITYHIYINDVYQDSLRVNQADVSVVRDVLLSGKMGEYRDLVTSVGKFFEQRRKSVEVALAVVSK